MAAGGVRALEAARAVGDFVLQVAAAVLGLEGIERVQARRAVRIDFDFVGAQAAAVRDDKQ